MSDYLPTPLGWPANLNVLKLTITTAADGLSEIIPMQGRAVAGLVMPAAWTAAAIQWYAFINGNIREKKTLKDGTTGVLMQSLVAADDWVVFPTGNAYFGPYLQLGSVTATTVTPVVQGAAREILLLTRKLFD